MDPFTPATELAAALRRRQFSPVELLDACLAQVDRLNPSLNAVVWRNDEQARREASLLAEDLAAGRDDLPPFAGVPIPIKDLTPVAGWPVTYGSFAAPEGPSAEDELVVAAFRRAGFVLTGRTNTPELGPIPATENLRYGITRNPWDPDRTPGGSSGGAAAAVASGMFPLAHANDGGGSIRIPAACSGLVGLKPSRGRVPAVVPGWMGASVEGAVTRTVADAAAVLDQICGPDPLSWYNAPAPDRPFAARGGGRPGPPPGGPAGPGAVGPAGRPGRGGRGAPGRQSARAALGHHVEEADFELFPVEVLAAFCRSCTPASATTRASISNAWSRTTAPRYEAGQSVDSIAFVRALGELQRFSRRPWPAGAGTSTCWSPRP